MSFDASQCLENGVGHAASAVGSITQLPSAAEGVGQAAAAVGSITQLPSAAEGVRQAAAAVGSIIELPEGVELPDLPTNVWNDLMDRDLLKQFSMQKAQHLVESIMKGAQSCRGGAEEERCGVERQVQGVQQTVRQDSEGSYEEVG